MEISINGGQMMPQPVYERAQDLVEELPGILGTIQPTAGEFHVTVKDSENRQLVHVHLHEGDKLLAEWSALTLRGLWERIRLAQEKAVELYTEKLKKSL